MCRYRCRDRVVWGHQTRFGLNFLGVAFQVIVGAKSAALVNENDGPHAVIHLCLVQHFDQIALDTRCHAVQALGGIEGHPDNTGVLQPYSKAAKCACVHDVLHSLFAVRLKFSLIRPPGLNAIAVKGVFLRAVKSIPNGKSVGLLVEQWNDVVSPLQNPVHGSYGGD